MWGVAVRGSEQPYMASNEPADLAFSAGFVGGLISVIPMGYTWNKWQPLDTVSYNSIGGTVMQGDTVIVCE